MTYIKSASVKIMLSYDYSHFESSLTIENEAGLSLSEIDEARKNCQRLCDKAVAQFKKAKEMAAKRTNSIYEMRQFENDCLRILEKPECDRTLKEIGMLKEYQDEKWRERFDRSYDYEDDDEDLPF